MRKIKRIGIIGGSYNPIHNGHLIIAERFREQLDLDLILFIPANISPFKVNNTSDNIEAQHRLNMVRLACRSNKNFKVEEYELKYNRVSYTINTIKHLKNKYLNSELYLLIGEDQAIQFNKWNKWQEIIQLCKVCVAGRDLKGEMKSQIDSIFACENNYKVIWVDSPLIEISSSDIRLRTKARKSITYLLPSSVRNYIEKNELYR